MEPTRKYFRLNTKLKRKLKELRKNGQNSLIPVHNGAIEYQGKSCKDVLENVELNELDKVGMYR